MLESELNDVVHAVGDLLDKHAAAPVDRYKLNDRIAQLIEEFGVEIEDDFSQADVGTQDPLSTRER